jgi:hypothetical protein
MTILAFAILFDFFSGLKGIEGLLGSVKVNEKQDFMEIRNAVMEERSQSSL